MASAVVLGRSLQKCYFRPQHCNKEISQLGQARKSEDRRRKLQLPKFHCPPGAPPCGRCGAWQGRTQLGWSLGGRRAKSRAHAWGGGQSGSTRKKRLCVSVWHRAETLRHSSGEYSGGDRALRAWKSLSPGECGVSHGLAHRLCMGSRD